MSNVISCVFLTTARKLLGLAMCVYNLSFDASFESCGYKFIVRIVGYLINILGY
jgi:hypothetical protein